MEKLLKFLLWTCGLFIALCVVGRLFVFETWTVPEGGYLAASSAPTLAGGDLVLVLTVGSTKFGDLVRCPDPEKADEFVVGRIAGLGGDDVEIQGPLLRVNGTRYTASEACLKPKFKVIHPDTGNEIEMACSRVEMGGSWHFRGTSLKNDRSGDMKKKVGPDKVFLLSDNRSIHDDSRDFGNLDHATCQQRIFFRLWGRDGWTDSESRLTFVR
ncbi:MAG: signal peptidase I [Myxococcales bacterium]|nr:signal peptidase I [Myxococcales bacterium]